MPDGIFPDIPRDRPSVEFFPVPPALKGAISGFNIYGTAGLPPGTTESYFPGWVTVRFAFGNSPFRIRSADGTVSEVPDAVLFGPASHQFDVILPADSISVGFGVTPLGLFRLFGIPANELADRTIDLKALWPDTQPLRERIAKQSDSAAAIEELSTAVAERLAPAKTDTSLITQLTDILVADHDISLAQLTLRTGRSTRALQRVALKHFGFPLKLLLRRSRFLKSLLAIYGVPPGEWAPRLDPSYYDQSQFIRDCRHFLGTTPGAFMRRSRPLYDLSIRKRAELIGEPFMALQPASD